MRTFRFLSWLLVLAAQATATSAARAQSAGSYAQFGSQPEPPAPIGAGQTQGISPSSVYAVGMQLGLSIAGSAKPSGQLIGSGLTSYQPTHGEHWNTIFYGNVSDMTAILGKGPDSVRAALASLAGKAQGLDVRAYEERFTSPTTKRVQWALWGSLGLKLNAAKSTIDTSVAYAYQARYTAGAEFRWTPRRDSVGHPIALSAEYVAGWLTNSAAEAVLKVPTRNLLTAELTLVVPCTAIPGLTAGFLANYALLAEQVVGLSTGMPNQARIGLLVTKSNSKSWPQAVDVRVAPFEVQC